MGAAPAGDATSSLDPPGNYKDLVDRSIASDDMKPLSCYSLNSEAVASIAARGDRASVPAVPPVVGDSAAACTAFCAPVPTLPPSRTLPALKESQMIVENDLVGTMDLVV